MTYSTAQAIFIASPEFFANSGGTRDSLGDGNLPDGARPRLRTPAGSKAG